MVCANPREIASRLEELHSVVARSQELWQGLAAFRREIVGTDFRTVLTEVCDQSSPWLRQPRATPARTVRTQQEWFAALADELAAASQLVAESVAILSRFGFTSAQPSKSELETALEQAKRLLQFPELPAQWFAGNPREIASRLIELHSAVARSQELWQGLAAFRREIVGTDFKTLLTEAYDQSGPWPKQLRAAPPHTVRTQQEWFTDLADELAAVRHLVAESVAILSRYGFTSAQSSKRELETALEKAKSLLQLPELPAQWFAHNPREIASRLVELHSAAARSQELWQGLAAFRSEIVGTDFKTLLTEVCDQSSPWLKQLRGTSSHGKDSTGMVRSPGRRVSGGAPTCGGDCRYRWRLFPGIASANRQRLHPGTPHQTYCVG